MYSYMRLIGRQNAPGQSSSLRKDLITPVTVPAPPLKSYGPPRISVEVRIASRNYNPIYPFEPLEFVRASPETEEFWGIVSAVEYSGKELLSEEDRKKYIISEPTESSDNNQMLLLPQVVFSLFVEAALKHYNKTHAIQDAEFELVERTCCKSLSYDYGPTFSHFNFKAQPKNDKSASPKLFYAEVESCMRKGVIVKKCCIIELKNAVASCEICQSWDFAWGAGPVYHPTEL